MGFPNPSAFRRAALFSACAVLVLAILMAVRLERDAASYLRAGDERYRKGEAAEAFFAWKMSISMYVPFSRTPRAAADRLWNAGEDALRKGNREEAFRAFGALRSGLLGIRHFGQPMADKLPRAEERMAALMPGGDSAARLRQLAARHGTSRAGYPFLIIGGLGWPASVLFLLGRRKKGEPAWRPGALLVPAAFLALLIAGVLLS
ncbi:MAG: hypothetical protein ACM3L8_00435 [Verrucomicrobiota bacterium]